MLTIVIPTKNNETILLNNLKMHFRTEIPEDVRILIHDNSKSESALIKGLVKKEKKITYVHVGSKLSVGQNFHAATHYVTTDFFCFIGDDDYIDFSNWEQLSACLDKEKVDNLNVPIYSIYFWKGSYCKFLPELRDYSVKIYMKPALKIAFRCILLVIGLLTRPQFIALTLPDLSRLPKAYYGIVSTSFYRENFTEILGSPDSFMSGKLKATLCAARTINLKQSFFIPGTSSGSTAGLSNKRSHDGKISEQSHFNKFEKAELERFNLDLFLPEIIWTLSFLLAQQKPLTPIHRQVLYFYILLKYRRNFWKIFVLNSPNLEYSLLYLPLSCILAMYCYIINRSSVALVVLFRYFFAKRFLA